VTLSALTPYVASFGLVLLRCSGLFFMVPTLGGNMIPLRVRGAVAALMSLILAATVGPIQPSSPLQLLIAGAGELLMGAAMGLMVRIALACAEMAGEAAGLQMGFAFSRIVDPLTREQSAVTSRILGSFAILVFIIADGHHMIVAGLLSSFRDAPAGTVLPRTEHAATMIPLVSATFVAAVRIAAPVMVALLVTNGAMALLARAAPQLNLFVFTFSITIGMGMLMLAFSSRFAISLVVQEVRNIPDYLLAVTGG